MPTLRLTRNYRFSASHRLHLARLSEKENHELFGKCNNPHGHGHNYAVTVTVEGPVDAETGLVVNPLALDDLVRREVLSVYDHAYINHEVPEFKNTVATTENMAYSIRDRLQAAWLKAFPAGNPALAHIRVQETKRNAVELPIIEGTV